MAIGRKGKIGVYGIKTRLLQRKLTYEVFGLTFKEAGVYLYLGDKNTTLPDINTFNSKVFFEVPDRLYTKFPIGIPVGMEVQQENKTDFSRFGLISPLTDETIFRFHIDDFDALGREMVVGDVFEVGFFEKGGKKAMWEVTDIDLKSEYEKYICIVSATVLESSRAMADIPFNRDNSSLMDDIMTDADAQYSEIIPAQDVNYIVDEEVIASEVDYRDEIQKGFLDDPTKNF